MRTLLSAAAALTFATGLATVAQADGGPPPWAYGFETPVPNPPPPRAQPNPAAHALEQHRSALTFECGQLLRDRGRGKAERLGCGRDRAAHRDLAQDAEAAHIEFHSENLITNLRNFNWT